MLDVPNFFWESEPTLYPLYIAVREYLEIKPRIQVLNERCRVFLDLAEILSDSIADNKTSRELPASLLPPCLPKLFPGKWMMLMDRPNLDYYRPDLYLYCGHYVRGVPTVWAAVYSGECLRLWLGE